jgi:transcriptional regulator with XRE-family HTH domain
LTLKAKKPVSREEYPDFLRTWGDHIKAQRLDLKLTKRQLSSKFHVDDTTIYLWEHNRVQPSVAQIPKIIEFLGKNPFEAKPENLGDKLRSYRRLKGLSQKKFAEQLGVDFTTLAGWERGEHRPTRRMLDKIKSVLII